MTAASAGRYLRSAQGDTCCAWGLQPKGARTAATGVAVHMQQVVARAGLDPRRSRGSKRSRYKESAATKR
eukprot:4562618-Alexandrium_andersonii.AAC.1